MASLSPKAALRAALAHYRAGRLKQAEELYQHVLQSEPRNAQALQFLGLISQTQGEHQKALDFLERSLRERPSDPAFLNNIGGVYRSLKQFDRARDAFSKAIQIQPNLAHAHANLGFTYRDLGQLDRAEESLRRAVQWDPKNAETLNRLGGVLEQQGKLTEAIEALRKAINIQPTHIEALVRIARLCYQLHYLDAAVRHQRDLLRLEPKNPSHINFLGAILAAMGQLDAAIAEYRRALEIDPNHLHALLNVGARLDQRGQRDEAIQFYRRAVEAHPESRLAEYNLAALTGRTESAAPVEYVRALFDEYADTFEQHLTEYLDYRIPQILADAVRRTAPNRTFDILDLGCGTGLCAEFCKSFAGRIVGVDLSPKMIEKSKQRNIYAELICADITAALQGFHDQFDLVLSADVFIYVGDLGAVFPAAAAAMRSGGIFAFSVEGKDGEGFELRPSRRYAHSIAYLKNLATKAGLSVIEISPTAIRKESDGPINGFIVLLSKP